MKPIGFSWLWFLVILVITAVLGSLSSVNHDNVTNFGTSVINGLRQHDVLLIVAALLTAVMLLWLLLVFITTVIASLIGPRSLNDRQRGV